MLTKLLSLKDGTQMNNLPMVMIWTIALFSFLLYLAYGQDDYTYRIQKVILDPGHGGDDFGAVGKSGLKEKDVALDIALKLAKILEDEGVEVYLTRKGDYFVDLSKRVLIADRYNADLFLSIHINAWTDPRASGMETYSFTEDPGKREAQLLAIKENEVAKDIDFFKIAPNLTTSELLLRTFERRYYWDMSEHFARVFFDGLSKNLDIKPRKPQKANFLVLRETRMPAVLLEIGYISNPRDEKLLSSGKFRQQAAQAIFKGLEKVMVKDEK